MPELHDFKYGGIQKIGLIYLCHIKDGQNPRLTNTCDKNQSGLEWMKLDRLYTIDQSKRPPIFPDIEKPLRQALASEAGIFGVWSPYHSESSQVENGDEAKKWFP